MDILKTPRFGQWVVRAVMPDELRDALLGDLEEGYRTTKSPRRWFWRQVARSLAPALAMRWRRPGVLRIGAGVAVAYALCVVLAAGLARLCAPVLAGADTRCAFMTVAAVVIGAVASMVAALVVPMAPRRAGRILAGVLLVMGTIPAGADFGRVPGWYTLVLIAAGPLGAWWGARNAPPERRLTAR